ncbi:hypothetical protein BGZ65_006512 [Modicella reniformis]|uniref:Uncharacterized protein n=1 Tax=Modicella reniformis TaxID=1440133 RepID=A0A9P6M8C0_9FUNG|nr:hypothetical protein BGZ65_006512 [Modicella reniformis]
MSDNYERWGSDEIDLLKRHINNIIPIDSRRRDEIVAELNRHRLAQNKNPRTQGSIISKLTRLRSSEKGVFLPGLVGTDDAREAVSVSARLVENELAFLSKGRHIAEVQQEFLRRKRENLQEREEILMRRMVEEANNEKQ